MFSKAKATITAARMEGLADGPLGSGQLQIGPQYPLLIVEGNDNRVDLTLTKLVFGVQFPVGAGFTKGRSLG